MSFQEDKWTESQVSKSDTNNQVINLLINILPNDIICRIGKCKNTYNLWTRLTELHENQSVLEDKLRSNQLKERVGLESTLREIKGKSLAKSSIDINSSLKIKKSYNMF